MKKNVHFAALFPWNFALITHNAPLSVNSSIRPRSSLACLRLNAQEEWFLAKVFLVHQSLLLT